MCALATILSAPLDRRKLGLVLDIAVVVLRVQNRTADAEADRRNDLLEVEGTVRKSEDAARDGLTVEVIRRTHERDVVCVAEHVVGCEELGSSHPQLRQDVVASLVLGPPRELANRVGRRRLHPAEALVEDVLRSVVLVDQGCDGIVLCVDESRRETDVDLTGDLRHRHVAEDEVEDVLQHTALIAAVVVADHARLRSAGEDAVAGLRGLDVVGEILVRRVDADVAGRLDDLMELGEDHGCVGASEVRVGHTRDLVHTRRVARRDAAVDEEVDIRRRRKVVLVTGHTEEVVGREATAHNHVRRSEHLGDVLEREVEGPELATERLDLRHGAEVAEGARKGRHFG